MLRRLAAVSVIVFGSSAPAPAQNASDMMNLFGQMMRAAVVDHARQEWSRIPPAELSCIEQALQQQGYSADRLIQNGVDPNAPGLAGLRQGCRASSAPPGPPTPQPAQVERLSSKPSFDCAKARSAVAQTICSGQAGAKADWELNSATWAMYFSLPEEQRDQFDEGEKRWLKSLPDVCRIVNGRVGPPQAQCILNSYRAHAAKFRSQLKGDALAESRLSPEQHAQIQAELIRRGLLNGVADGEFGQNTRDAIKTFQEQSGLPSTGFLTAAERQQLGPAVESVSQAQCEVTDPTGTPLNIRRSPNGDVIGTVDNGLPIQIVQTLQDDRGRSWSSIERTSDHQTLGWVFRQYITCAEPSLKAPQITDVDLQQRAS